MTPRSLSKNLLQEIKESFEDRIWKRGRGYLEDGHIVSMNYRQGTFHFRIEGSGRTKYEIDINQDIFIGVVDGYCTCPYDYECKHLAAAAQLIFHVCQHLQSGKPTDSYIQNSWIPIISRALENYLPHPMHFREDPGEDKNAEFLVKVLFDRLERSFELQPKKQSKTDETSTQIKKYRGGIVFSFESYSVPHRWESYNFLPSGFSLFPVSQYRKLTGEYGAFVRYSPSHQIINMTPTIQRLLAGLRRETPGSVPYGDLLTPVFSTNDLPLFYTKGSDTRDLKPLDRWVGTSVSGFFDIDTETSLRTYRPKIKVEIGEKWYIFAPGGPDCHLLLFGNSNFLLEGTNGWILQLPILTSMAQDFLVGLWEYPSTLSLSEAHVFAQRFSTIVPWDSPLAESDRPVIRPVTELYLGSVIQPGTNSYYLEILFQYPQEDSLFKRDSNFETKSSRELTRILKEYLRNPEEGLMAGPSRVIDWQVRPLVVFLADTFPSLPEGTEVRVYVDKKLLHVRPCRYLQILKSSGIDWFDLRLGTDEGLEITRDNLDFASGIVWSQGQFSRLSPEDLERARDIFYNSEDITGLEYSSWNMEGLRSLEEVRNIENFPKLYEKILLARRFLEAQKSPVPLSPLFQGSLRDYQQAGYVWLWALYESKFGGILADDMGLGKTIQILALMSAVLDSNPKSTLLIVAPVSTLGNWEREFSRFVPSITVNSYYGSQRRFSVSHRRQVVLTGYQTLARDREVLGQENWDLLVLDEGQFLKNRRTDIRQTVKSLRARSTIILSGTPIENRIEELWSLVDIVAEGLLGSEKDFRRRYTKDKGINRVLELQNRLRPFLLRRTKEQAALELPPREERLIMVDQDEEERTYYLVQQARCREEIARLMGEITDSQSAFRAMTEVVRSINYLRILAVAPRLRGGQEDGTKIRRVLEKLEEALEEGHSVLLFSQYVQVLQIIVAELEARSIEYAYLDGSLPPKKRKLQIERFTNNPKTRTFLLSIRAGGTGINLVKADYVFIVDPWWNPAVENQAIDRSHRIGQVNPVLATRFLVRGTIEEKVQTLQDSKRRLFDELLSDGSSVFSRLHSEEILDLFNPKE